MKPVQHPWHHRQPPVEVHRVTDARRARSDDQHARMTKYLILMTVRLLCLGLAFLVPSPWFWLCVVGAMVLPYIAVLIANLGAEQRPAPFERATPPPPAALGSRSPVLPPDVDSR